MSQSKLGNKVKPAKVRQKFVTLDDALWKRMEAAQEKFKDPAGNTPHMDACIGFWLAGFLDMFEEALKREEQKSRLVLDASEVSTEVLNRVVRPRPGESIRVAT